MMHSITVLLFPMLNIKYTHREVVLYSITREGETGRTLAQFFLIASASTITASTLDQLIFIDLWPRAIGGKRSINLGDFLHPFFF
jgi:hypothetical protein